MRLKIRYEKKGKSLRLFLYNNAFLEYLKSDFELNSRKTFSAKIPQKLIDWKFSKNILRGLFETDGSLYFSHTGKEKIANYPRIEIKTSSKELMKQVFSVLMSREFQPHVRTCKSDNTFGIFVSGKFALEKWVQEIGFNSNKNKTKYEIWKRLGFYIPRSSLSDRQKCLRSEFG